MPVRAESEARLLDACTSVLSLRAVSGLQKLLSPEAIQEATRAEPGAQGLSRHTVYRHWPNRGEAVVDIANYLGDPEANGAMGMMANAAKGRRSGPTGHETARRPASAVAETVRERTIYGFRSMVGASLELQLGSHSLAANWVLQAAATTSSPVWRGLRPDPADEAIGRRILAARAASYQEMVDRWSIALRTAMSSLGRRPRTGFTVESITQACLHVYEGFLLHAFADPQVNDETLDHEERQARLHEAIDLACRAMFELTWGLTEPGTLADPRRPMYDPASETAAVFDEVVGAAQQLYLAGNVDIVDSTVAARTADVPADLVSAMFPDAGDLADSVLRRLVAGSGEMSSRSAKIAPLSIVRDVLSRLSDAASSCPKLLDAVRSHPPTHPPDATPLLDELGKAITDALGSPLLTCREPAKTADRLLGFALDGTRGWPAVEAMLDLLDSADDSADDPA